MNLGCRILGSPTAVARMVAAVLRLHTMASGVLCVMTVGTRPIRKLRVAVLGAPPMVPEPLLEILKMERFPTLEPSEVVKGQSG